MKQKRIAILAWTLCAFCVLSAVISLIIWLAQLTTPRMSGQTPSLFDLSGALGWELAVPVVFSVLAALIIARQPGNRVGWMMMLIGLASIIPAYTQPMIDNLPAPPTTMTLGLWLLIWFTGWLWISAIFPLFLILLHFPTGHPPSHRWNWVNWLALGMWLFFIVLTAFSDTIGPLNAKWRLPNPIGFIPTDEGSLFLIGWVFGLATLLLSSVASLFVRSRRAQAGERQQIKWLLYASGLFATGYLMFYYIGLNSQNETTRGFGSFVIVSAILTIPAAIAIAILRYRLYDIDIIIRRTLQYSLLTGLLGLTYLGSIVFLQRIFGNLTGDSDSPIITVLSTLAIAALSTPLRIRIQNFIDRRFYRKKYNAEQTLAQFAATARDEVDMDKLTAALIGVVQETMQPERVSLWLKDSGKVKGEK